MIEPLNAIAMRHLFAYLLLATGPIFAQSAGDYELTNLEDLNTPAAEFSAIPWAEGVVFTSTRKRHSLTACTDELTGEGYADLYESVKTLGGYRAPEPLAGKTNQRYNDGTATFVDNDNQMYFTRNNTRGANDKEVMALKIYSAERDGATWRNEREFPFNGEDFSTCHPAVSADGLRMYFSSDKAGGYGGMDLYVAFRKEGGWADAVNLGPKVNTSGNEIFPFVDALERLYFSSTGHAGNGGLDVFVSQKGDLADENSWRIPQPLPAPINSSEDDFAFVSIDNGKKGFLSSNRPGGMGSDDLYEWRYTGEPTLQLPMAVEDETTGQRIDNASIAIFPKGTQLGEWSPRQRVVESLEGEMFMIKKDEEELGKVSFTDPTGETVPTLEAEKEYLVVVEKEGYERTETTVRGSDLNPDDILAIPIGKAVTTARLRVDVRKRRTRETVRGIAVHLLNQCTGETQTFTSDDEGIVEAELDCRCAYTLSSGSTSHREFNQEVRPDCQKATDLRTGIDLEDRVATPPAPAVETHALGHAPLEVGQLFTLQNVYYDYDKATIRPDAGVDLDKVVSAMRQFPKLVIELSSHTDARGSDSYNLQLSQRRAEAAVRYIIGQGIDKSRIVARGYGETRLINECGNGVRCPDLAHQQNRRTEVRILQK